MSQQGGPNEIGAVSVGVGADLEALRKGLEQAKQDAGKAGEDAGKAFVEGMGKGADSGPASIGSGKGSAPGSKLPPIGPDLWKEMGGDALESDLAGAAAGGEAAGGAGMAGGLAAGAAITGIAMAIIAASNKMVEAIERQAKSNYELGKSLGDALFETRKQMLELDQAIRFSAESLAKQQAINSGIYDRATGGNLNVSKEADDRRKQLESEVEADRAKLLQFQTNVPKKLFESLISNDRKGFLDTATEEAALERQLAEDEGRLNRQLAQTGGIVNRERMRSTLGGRAIAGGIAERGEIGWGPSLSPAGAAAVDDMIRDNPSAMREQLKWLRMNYMQQQDFITDQRRGGREVQR